MTEGSDREPYFVAAANGPSKRAKRKGKIRRWLSLAAAKEQN
jgi:hypothetical protein